MNKTKRKTRRNSRRNTPDEITLNGARYRRVNRNGLGSLDSPYIPTSETCTVLDTQVPDSMDYETHIAVRKVKNDIGMNLVEYVASRLDISMDDICKSLAAEQIDAVAMAIYNIEVRKQGIIIGDQTGIGKGRIAAAMLRYGFVQGLKPIFLSEKANLFSDIYRDIIDIGADDGIPMETVSDVPDLKKIKYEPWEKLSDEEKSEHDNDPSKYDEFINNPDNQYEEVFKRSKNKNFDLKKGLRLRPLIMNGKASKTDIIDKNGNLLYRGEEKSKLDAIFASNKIPVEFDVVLGTYSQFNSEKRVAKRRFLQEIAQDNIIVMDEAHNASGTSSTGEYLQGVLKSCKGVTFLSATFAKRPDNMPIYAMKTAMSEANISNIEMVESILRGGVALQEIISSQLVAEGQMLRRERSFEGIEVNYISLDDKKDEHRAISDNITGILRDIIKFQEDYVKPIVKGMDKAAAGEGKEVTERGGTNMAGIDNTPYFSKIFNVINQLLFSIKAESVADKTIQRLREGRKPVIAFASTMGAFLESITNDQGNPVQQGDMVNTDFATVLTRGLDGVLRITEKDAKGVSKRGEINVSELGEDGSAEYFRISEKIRNTTSGISISPIDLIISKIEAAGFKVAEVTGRRLEVVYDMKKAVRRKDKTDHQVENDYKEQEPLKMSDFSKFPLTAKFMPKFQQLTIVGSREHWDILSRIEATLAVMRKANGPKLHDKLNKTHPSWAHNFDYVPVFFHFFYAGSDWWIYEWDGKDTVFGFAVLNGDWMYAELGSSSLSEIAASHVELDFFWTPKTLMEAKHNSDPDNKLPDNYQVADEFYDKLLKKEYGFSYDFGGKMSFHGFKRRGTFGSFNDNPMMGMVMNRKKINTNDAFRKFNNNEVDVLMINQSGSTGASAHAIVTDKVKRDQVKQRVMIILQAELNINTEVQKRGRVNRTGQIMKPIYDYVNSAIPAEKRMMMMLKKKLKSLDANTTSNQKQSDAVMASDDFLNKYGDEIVFDYLDENLALNLFLGDILRKSSSENGQADKGVKEGIAHKASGRVAVLSCAEQEEFYTDILVRYDRHVESLKNKGQYDLEVETMNLEAETISATMTIAGKSGGKSAFAGDTILEKCRVNNLRKPFTRDELENLIKKQLGDANPKEIREELKNEFKDFMVKKYNNEVQELTERAERNIGMVPKEKQYLKLENAADQESYKKKRTDEINNDTKLKIEKSREELNGRYKYMNAIFSVFMIGYCYDYPSAAQTTVKCVFLGYKIDRSKSNPYAPSAVSLSFAIADSTKSIDLVCSGDDGGIIYKIIGMSRNESEYDQVRYANYWDRYISESSATKKIVYIVTGNILQAYSKFQGHLISYSTSDGGVKKGILMPHGFDPSAKKSDAEFVTIPIIKCRKILSWQMHSGTGIKSTSGILFGKDYDGRFKIAVPKSKNYQEIFKNQDIINLSLNPYDGFNMISNMMVARFESRNIDALIDVLHEKFATNLEINPNLYDIDINVDTSAGSGIEKDEATLIAERQFATDKENFNCRKEPASCIPVPPVENVVPPDKSRKKKLAIAKARARARLRATGN